MRTFFYPFLMVMFLAACTGGGADTPEKTVSPAPSAQPQATEDTGDALVTTPITTEVETGVVTEETGALANLSDPGALEGLTPRELQDILGGPSLVRRDGSMQILQYGGTACVLDVVFYEASENAHFRAAAIAARDLSGANTEAGACLYGIVTGR